MFSLTILNNKEKDRSEIHIEGDMTKEETTIIVALSFVLRKIWQESYSNDMGFKSFLKAFTNLSLEAEAELIQEEEINDNSCPSIRSIGKLQ